MSKNKLIIHEARETLEKMIKEQEKQWLGLGHNPNPNVPDIPEGFGSALYQEPKARINFEKLSDIQKTNVIKYVQSNNLTGNDARNKINNAVNDLKNNNLETV